MLLERRPDKGLLGGMLGWPGNDWSTDKPEAIPPFEANWQILSAEARHTFTHFHLKLHIQKAIVVNDITQDVGTFVDVKTFDVNDLPTIMRKVWKLAIPVA